MTLPPAAPVQVFVRIRPLIEEEEGHSEISYKIDESSTKLQIQLPPKQSRSSLNPALAAKQTQLPPHLAKRLQRKAEWKSFGGLTSVLGPEHDNEATYQATVPSLLPQIVSEQQSACVFTYGHTGSGKSHTLLGYEDKQSLGIYVYTAKDLLQLLEKDNQSLEAPQQRLLTVRVTELYCDMVKDLLSGSTDCAIRESHNGVVQVRGPMIEDEKTGKIDQQPLGQACRTWEEVVSCVETACANRRVGTSTHHSQSSRSHLVMEIEIVTQELIDLRNLNLKQYTHLTRLRWLQYERSFGKKLSDEQMPQWTMSYDSPMKLRGEIREYEKLVKETQGQLEELGAGLGGTLVICDLAGNEYAKDSGNSTQQEREEAAAINMSLLAVKELIRGLHANANDVSNNKVQRVPYRNSKLSMLLKRHLEGKHSRAIMMAHMSPSQDHVRKTINTLNYTTLVGTAATSSSSNNKTAKLKTNNCTSTQNEGKENHQQV